MADIIEIQRGHPDDRQRRMDELTPQAIVAELDKYIIGQREAKRAVAVALRNRTRRQRVDDPIRAEIQPKNILMIGPTGVGKTEISRRLAKLVSSPFLKVEATKFTEVGYVGRDVDSMVRDLVETSIGMVRQEEIERVKPQAERMVEDRILDALIPQPEHTDDERQESYQRTREKFRQRLRAGEMEDREIDVRVQESSMPQISVFGGEGQDQMGMDMSILSDLFPSKTVEKRLPIREARDLLFNQEAEKLINDEEIQRQGLERAQESGLIFLDEIDKLASGGREEQGGPGVSRQGVQRDILPLLEGSTVRTRYGYVSTDNILFIASGAFTMAKPSDLVPELQGRLPIRVELDSLGQDDFVRILTEPEDALVKQYRALLGTENLDMDFEDEAVHEIARIAHELNSTTENIGARRLQTVMEKLMEDLAFETADLSKRETFTVTPDYVREKLAHIAEDMDLSRYIL